MVGEKINKLKEVSRLKWREIADVVGVQPATLFLWRNGFYKRMKPESEIKLKEAFKKYGIK